MSTSAISFSHFHQGSKTILFFQYNSKSCASTYF
jgi:hypothetical protein